MELQKTKTFKIENKDFVRVTSQDRSIDLKDQFISLEIFVDDWENPKYVRHCPNYIDIYKNETKIIEFPTDGEDMSIVAYSDDPSVDLSKLDISGY